MDIYQPLLFVGLGGTGCKVGAELERRLREALCGPDGTELQARLGNKVLPYQLPSCLQFVYADLSAFELEQTRRKAAPGGEHDDAAHRTRHLITNLIPNDLHNSGQVGQRLRTYLGSDVIGWLPSQQSDPNVAPLIDGAGQFPTVARAVLFESMRRSQDIVLGGLTSAMTAINRCGGEIAPLGGRLGGSIDVFVAFSVAGGTGSGLFYDYLHLIGEQLKNSGKQARIYPLVLMPSGFDIGQGGGRPAELNSGAALIDLFRLIDNQNAQTIDTVYSHGIDSDESGGTVVKVRYPGQQPPVKLDAASVQTAFLFGRPKDGVETEDLHRCMVSLVLSLVGAGPNAAADGAPGAGTQQSFADTFVNHKGARSTSSDTGIGLRGVSTSAVADLTIPVAEIVDIVSQHLLAEAVRQLVTPPGGRAEGNAELMSHFFKASGLEALQHRQTREITELEVKPGRDKILAALQWRAKEMEDNLRALDEDLGSHVPEMARNFDPGGAAMELLRTIDPFRLKRVALGDQSLTDRLEREGFGKILSDRRFAALPPPGWEGLTRNPPQPQGLRRGAIRLRWSDESVQHNVQAQNVWYQWRTQQVWNSVWGEHERLWEHLWKGFADELESLVDAFRVHADADTGRYTSRSEDLYRDRLGVSYLLPPHEGGMKGFYALVVDSFRVLYREHLTTNSGEGDIVNLIMSANRGWQKSYSEGHERNPAAAIAVALQHIKRAVHERIRPSGQSALLPEMQDLLLRAAGQPPRAVGGDVSDADLAQFKQRIRDVVPGGYNPAGHGPLDILISYPSGAQSGPLEQYLERELELPDHAGVSPQFRPINRDSIGVVLFRTSMGLTEVPECRGAVKLWSSATRKSLRNDRLDWRRRLTPAAGYLHMTETDRQVVLHRLLCALWNGQIEVSPKDGIANPERVLIKLPDDDLDKRPSVELKLAGFRGLSSWASILQVYEEWIVEDDEPMRRALASVVMEAAPAGLDRDPEPPTAVFTALIDMKDAQLKLIDELRKRKVSGMASRLEIFEDFWAHTLPSALNLEFPGHRGSGIANLRELIDVIADEHPDPEAR